MSGQGYMIHFVSKKTKRRTCQYVDGNNPMDAVHTFNRLTRNRHIVVDVQTVPKIEIQTGNVKGIADSQLADNEKKKENNDGCQEKAAEPRIRRKPS